MINERIRLNRRDFLKLGALSFGSILAFPNTLTTALAETVSCTEKIPTTAGTFAPINPRVSIRFDPLDIFKVEEPKTNIEVPKISGPLSVEELRFYNQKQDFWLGKFFPDHNPIFVDQWDTKQYPDYDDRLWSFEGYMNDSCVPATFLEIERWADRIAGRTRERSIMQIIDSLDGKSYIQGTSKGESPIIRTGGRPGVSFFAYKKALEILFSETHDCRVVEIAQNLETFEEGGIQYVNPIPYSEWPKIHERAESVTSQGGVILVHVSLYRGHAMLVSSLPPKPEGKTLILDTRGPKRLGHGRIVEDSFSGYCGYLAYALGVIPNISPRNIPE